MNKCLWCGAKLDNPKARFCNAKHRMRFKRENGRKGKTLTIIEENPNNSEKPEQVAVVAGKPLVFTDETTEERIAIYKQTYPNSSFVPNWVRKGYNSKAEAIVDVLRKLGENAEAIHSHSSTGEFTITLGDDSVIYEKKRKKNKRVGGGKG